MDTQSFVSPEKPITPQVKPPVDPTKKKSLFNILLSVIGFLLLVLIASVLLIAFSGKETGPLASLIGLNQSQFIDMLVVAVHIVMMIFALGILALLMIGLYKLNKVKKEEIFLKKKALRTTIFWGASLFVFFIVWLFMYVYLDGKRLPDPDAIKNAIMTEPEELLNLTAPIEIRFDASKAPIDTRKFQIISYKWDFGDGETATNQIVSHIFKDKGKDDGRFEVVLNITKRNKETQEETISTYTKTVVIANQALSAIIEADPQSGEAPLEVEFDASGSVDPDGVISAYEWDFDKDGQFDDAEGVKVKHEFEKVGTYTVRLRVTSTTEEYNVAEKEIEVVEESLPKAVIEVADEPESFVIGVEYIFKGGDSTSPNGDIKEYLWDFGDGSRTENTRTVSHEFTKEGKFIVSLKVKDEKNEEGEITKEIVVGTPEGVPKAVIKTSPALGQNEIVLEGKLPFDVTFDAKDSLDSDDNIVDYEWDFDGNGTVDGAGETVNHTYTSEGTFEAVLKITDADENTSEAKIAIKVLPQGIAAILTADKVEGNAPLTVKFDATGSTYKNGQITSYRWNFGDKTAEKLGSATITHRYTSVGVYTAKVTVIGSDNATSTAQILITVREVPLEACFTPVFEEGTSPLENGFDPSCSTGTITSYFWDFGDGETSTSVKPTHTFDEPGQYTVLLEISDTDNTVSQAERVITVN